MSVADVDAAIDAIRRDPLCRLSPPAGMPAVAAGLVLPAEVERLYELCGGIEFRVAAEVTSPDYLILPPPAVVDMGVATYGVAETDPTRRQWYAIGRDDNHEYAAVDLATDRVGRVYDVFHETYDRAEYARVVARSVAEFLTRLSRRRRSYWFDDGYVGHGHFGDR